MSLVLASQAPGDFLIRVHANSFKIANAMLKGEGPADLICEVTASKPFRSDPKNQDVPHGLTVRLVRVTLDNGEYEVLVTSLTDRQQYPTSIFKELYYLRWGIETFYGILKTRLGLENFSGYSPEAIRQDFRVAVLLTGVEGILIEDAEEELKKQHGGYPKKVNKAVSFNAIKDKAFELFMSTGPQDEVLTELTELFMQNPTVVRKDRRPPRVTRSSTMYWAFGNDNGRWCFREKTVEHERTNRSRVGIIDSGYIDKYCLKCLCTFLLYFHVGSAECRWATRVRARQKELLF
jgi:hypothetical protein